MSDFRINGPGPGRLQRAVATAGIAVLAVVGALLGLAVFVALLGVVLVAGSVVATRIWWLRRRMERELHTDAETRSRTQPDVIEGEFHVVHEEDDRRQ